MKFTILCLWWPLVEEEVMKQSEVGLSKGLFYEEKSS
jgi:hypothetical protein